MQIQPQFTQQCLFGWGKNDGKVLVNHSKKIKLTIPQKIKIQLQIESICSISTATLFLSKQGEVYQLKFSTLRKIKNLQNIIKICSGSNHFLALNIQNQVFSYGEGRNGCLGTGQLQNYQVPQQIMQQHKIIDIFCGSFTSFFITDNQQIYGCGLNKYGELAHPSFKCHFAPTLIDTKGIKIVEIAGGIQHTLFLSNQGEVYSVGNGRNGRLGISSENDFNYRLQKVKTDQKFKAISASRYSGALNEKGEIFIWGNTLFGNFKQPTILFNLNNSFNSLIIYQENGYALTNQGELWVWGNNSYGQLGIANSEVSFKPTRLIYLQNRIIKKIFAGPNCAFCISYFVKQKQIIKNELKQINIVGQKKQARVKQKITVNSASKIISSKSNTRSLNHSINYQKKSYRSNIQDGSKMKFTKTKTNIRNKYKQKSMNQRYKSLKYSLISDQIGNQKQEKLDITGKYDTINNQTLKFSSVEINQLENVQKQLKLYKKENIKLVNLIKQKDFIIEDITQKIKLLEDTIAHKQKLYRKFNQQLVIQQMKKNENKYLKSIQKLNDSITSIYKQKQSNNQINSYSHDQSHIYQKYIKQIELKNQHFLKEIKSKDKKIQQAGKYIKLIQTKIEKVEKQFEQYKKQNVKPIQLNEYIGKLKNREEKIVSEPKKQIKFKERIIQLEKELNRQNLEQYQKNKLNKQEIAILNQKIKKLQFSIKLKDKQIFDLKQKLIQQNVRKQSYRQISQQLISPFNKKLKNSNQIFLDISQKQNHQGQQEFKSHTQQILKDKSNLIMNNDIKKVKVKKV